MSRITVAQTNERIDKIESKLDTLLAKLDKITTSTTNNVKPDNTQLTKRQAGIERKLSNAFGKASLHGKVWTIPDTDITACAYHDRDWTWLFFSEKPPTEVYNAICETFGTRLKPRRWGLPIQTKIEFGELQDMILAAFE